MKTVKNYDNFSEEYRLNENLLKKAWGAILNFFKRKYKDTAWLYYALYLKKTGQLPANKVEIIVPSSYNVSDIPSQKEVESELETESMSDVRFNYTMINEETVSLDHPNPKMRNVDVSGLVEKVVRIYNMNKVRVETGKKRTKNHALFIWGAPGIGKTEILNQVAEKLKIVVQEWHLSQIEPTDFRGIPKIENVVPGSTDLADERTVTKLPAIFPTNNGENGLGGIMFFDEINRAPKMVLAAALSLCLGGKIGTYELPSMWIVIAAGNRAEDLLGAPVTTIEPALANRFGHINYSPKLATWIDWAMTKDTINPDIIAFLTWNKSYFHKLDSEVEELAWPSPRSWELASEEDYAARGYDWSNKGNMNTMQEIYTDTIGAEAAVAFMSYLKLKEFYNEKDVADVYKKGKLAKKPPVKLDQARAAGASVALFKKGEKLTVGELNNVLDWTLDLPTVEAKTSMLSFFRMAHPYVKTEDPYQKIWWDYVKKWHLEMKELE